MTNVYDIIERIRDGHNLTTRHLAIMAGIAPTTLESAFQRKPNQIRKTMLQRIAGVFLLPWYTLMTSSGDENQVPRGKNPTFIPCDQIDDDDAERIVSHFLAIPTPECTPPRQGFSTVGVQSLSPISSTAHMDEHLRQSILFMLRRLNSEGLMEVMGHTLAAAKNPAYLRKEETPCDSTAQQ